MVLRSDRDGGSGSRWRRCLDRKKADEENCVQDILDSTFSLKTDFAPRLRSSSVEPGRAGRLGYGALTYILLINPLGMICPLALLFAKLSKPFTFQRRLLEISV